MRSVRALCILLAALAAASAARAELAKNIILVIGDGCGYEQVKAGSDFISGGTGALVFEPFWKGSVNTYSLGSAVTDSAAAATAMATGVKVYNGTISSNPDGSPITTILEIAKQQGKMTGLVTSVPVSHATPAAFGSHETTRASTTAITEDYLTQTQPDVILGAGDPAKGGAEYVTEQQIAHAQALGYTVVRDVSQLLAVPTTTARLLGLFGGTGMTWEYYWKATTPEPHLSQTTAKALEILGRDPDGFFLMVESGAIDWACSSNRIDLATSEVVEMNNAVQLILDWSGGRDDTLVIVTADHETGGLTAVNKGPGITPGAVWQTTGHTGAYVPIYAWGACSHYVDRYLSTGIMDNTEVFRVMQSALSEPGAEGPQIATVKNGLGPVTLTSKIVTAGNNQLHNSGFIQDSDRSSGIKLYTTQVLRPGDVVDVTGKIYNGGGEQLMANPSITVYPGPRPLPDPLLMSNRTFLEWNAASSMGLLVRVWGRVVSVSPSTGVFRIDEGIGTAYGASPGIAVKYGGLAAGNSITPPAVGQLVLLTGIASRVTTPPNYPAVQLREQSDIAEMM